MAYNRSLVALGLAAFRGGLIQECHSHLGDIMNKDKNIKDLLAQNFAKQGESDIKQNIPYHLSLNVEVIETVYLTAAMILEMPNVLVDPFEDQQKVISKKFRQLCTYYDSQAFNGQPENNRDIIYAASKELGKGDWKKCWKWLNELQFWQKLPSVEEAQKAVQQKVKESALKCYLFTFKDVFKNITFAHLASFFEMDEPEVRRRVLRMIYNGELKAKVEGADKSFIEFQHDEQTQIRRVAHQLVEKVNNLAKNNEKLLVLYLILAIHIGLQTGQLRVPAGREGSAGQPAEVEGQVQEEAGAAAVQKEQSFREEEGVSILS